MITAFLPCRAGSERIPRKNTRKFAGLDYGLVGNKLVQLAQCDDIERIVLSTDDPVVIELALSVSDAREKLDLDHRPSELCQSSTSTDELILYVPSVIPSGTILWTHVTSPFMNARDYSAAINEYITGIDRGIADSLMTVTRVQEFLWTRDSPVNYDRTLEKWPRTQTLEPLYAINSAAFIIDANLMSVMGDRIGESPILFELDALKGFDVDWEDQFTVAEAIAYGFTYSGVPDQL